MPDLDGSHPADKRNPPDNLKLKAFTARCWARARLWRDGAYGDTRDASALHCAVDALQHQAEREGFLTAIGQDAVQAIMADAFREVREGPFGDLGPPAARRPSESCPLGLCENGVCADPGFCAGARIADAAADAAADAERARAAEMHEPLPRTPQTTIDAIMWCVFKRGISALDEPANVERLSHCDEHARKNINERIRNITTRLTQRGLKP
jgi:hypothetical protein